MDQLIDEKGEEEDPILDIENEVVKFLRKNPTKNANFLRIKYGKNWAARFEQLQNNGLVTANEQALTLIPGDRFLI
jgi:hypothetical protein